MVLLEGLYSKIVTENGTIVIKFWNIKKPKWKTNELNREQMYICAYMC